jgi:hypothetical protein
MAGKAFEDWITRKRPHGEMSAGHAGQKAVISLSQETRFPRKRRSREYSIVPSCWDRPEGPVSGICTGRPLTVQVFQTIQRYRSRTPGALAKAATTWRSTGIRCSSLF